MGGVLHEWLELIHDHPEPEWNAARIDASQGAIRSCLLRAGAAENRVEELTLRCVAALRAALADDHLKSVLALEREGQSWSELELYRRDGPGFSLHVIDLLIRHPRGGYLVLDYKSGFRSEAEARDDVAWQDQLRRYRELVESLTGEPASEGRVHLLEQTGLPEQGP
jgi:ATP-dependent exoDNAse (exonuclease V) beta subunit